MQTVTVEPGILYFGTPVVLISTCNADGSVNLAPMSSAFWLGWRCILGLGASAKTTENLLRTGECVLNLPSPAEAAAVNRLARLTGSDPVPARKQAIGYTHEKHKFAIAGLTAVPSQRVAPPRALECPVQLEATLCASHAVMEDIPAASKAILTFEVRILRVHAHPSILATGTEDRIDPDRWRPLIMSFQRFYELAPGQVHPSTLSRIPEAAYRTPDIERARGAGTL